MNEVPATIKAQLFSLLEELGKRHPYVSFDEIRNAAHVTWPDLRDDTLRHYLAEAPSRGILHDAGRGWYSPLAEAAILPAAAVQQSIDLISQAFPLLEFACWSTVHWNPWLRHLVDRSTVFLSCDTVSLPTIHDFLKRRGLDSRANPSAAEIAKNPLGPETFVLRPRLAATPGDGPIASVEQVIVDSWVENKAFHLFDAAELREASLAWVRQRRIQLPTLFRYLAARGGSKEDVFGDLSIIAK